MDLGILDHVNIVVIYSLAKKTIVVFHNHKAPDQKMKYIFPHSANYSVLFNIAPILYLELITSANFVRKSVTNVILGRYALPEYFMKKLYEKY